MKQFTTVLFELELNRFTKAHCAKASFAQDDGTRHKWLGIAADSFTKSTAVFTYIDSIIKTNLANHLTEVQSGPNLQR